MSTEQSKFVGQHAAWLHDYFDRIAALHSVGVHGSRSEDHALICIVDDQGQLWHRWRHVISPMSVRFAVMNFEQQKAEWTKGEPPAADVGVRVTRGDSRRLRGLNVL